MTLQHHEMRAACAETPFSYCTVDAVPLIRRKYHAETSDGDSIKTWTDDIILSFIYIYIYNAHAL